MKKPKSAKNLFYAAFVLMIVAVSWGILAPYIKGLLKNRMLEQSEITQDATYERSTIQTKRHSDAGGLLFRGCHRSRRSNNHKT